jgi:hypothetical protein
MLENVSQRLDAFLDFKLSDSSISRRQSCARRTRNALPAYSIHSDPERRRFGDKAFFTCAPLGSKDNMSSGTVASCFHAIAQIHFDRPCGVS